MIPSRASVVVVGLVACLAVAVGAPGASRTIASAEEAPGDPSTTTVPTAPPPTGDPGTTTTTTAGPGTTVPIGPAPTTPSTAPTPSTASTAPAPEAATTPELAAGSTYVALGDSFSSGEGVPPFVPGTDVLGVNGCHRSQRAYPSLLAGKPGVPSAAFTVHVACSGARIFHLLRGQWNEPSQLAWLNGTTGLVTLTIGGNDVGYGTTAFWCLLTPSCQAAWADRIQDRSEAVGRALPGVYRAIARAAPNARVLVVGYPRLFPKYPSRDCAQQLGTFDRGEQRWMNAAFARLDHEIRRAVESLGLSRVRYVDVYDAFRGYELCGRGGAVNPVSIRDHLSSLHPSAFGQALISNRVLVAARAA